MTQLLQKAQQFSSPQEGYPTREDMIRDHWKRYGGMHLFRSGPACTMYVRHRLYPYKGLEGPVDKIMDDTIMFRLELGVIPFDQSTPDHLERAFQYLDLPAYRVICEGIVCEEGFV